MGKDKSIFPITSEKEELQFYSFKEVVDQDVYFVRVIELEMKLS